MPFWISVVEWLARLILMGLLGLSVWSVAIILDRKKFFKNLDKKDFLKKLQAKAARYSIEKSETAISLDMYKQKTAMESGLNVLGSLGSTTPFIGLLGTILGIIVAFGELSMGKADTNAIMFALAEALILTAVGLFVAIPAVIAFNYFKKRTFSFFAEVRSEMDVYSSNRKAP